MSHVLSIQDSFQLQHRQHRTSTVERHAHQNEDSQRSLFPTTKFSLLLLLCVCSCSSLHLTTCVFLLHPRTVPLLLLVWQEQASGTVPAKQRKPYPMPTMVGING
jgi:hypothetical protein